VPDSTKAGGDRVSDLNAARPSGARSKAVDITADDARAMVDAVLAGYGLDPEKCSDLFGWRHVSVGSARGQVGVVERMKGLHYLVAVAPVLLLPEGEQVPSGFYELLLELNHDRTLSSHFSIHDGVVYVSLTRPIRGLDEAEVDDAVRTVMMVADGWDEELKRALDAFLNAVPRVVELPNIKMMPKEAQMVTAVLAHSDSHARDIFRYLMERWQRYDYVVDPAEAGIGLKIPLGDKSYSLASMGPSHGDSPALLILGWESLRKRRAFPAKAIDKYQKAVTKIIELTKVTESTAHIEVTESFDLESAKALLRAMRALAKEAQPERDDEPVTWPPNLPQMDIDVGDVTLANMRDTLLACEREVQNKFAVLIEGWAQAGGTVQCSKPGRIYLKFKTREHELPELGRLSHNFNLAVLAAPKGKKGPSIDVAWDLATSAYPYLDYVPDEVARFEAAVSELPGYHKHGTVTRLTVDEAFGPEHATKLLEAMLALKAAGGAT